MYLCMHSFNVLKLLLCNRYFMRPWNTKVKDMIPAPKLFIKIMGKDIKWKLNLVYFRVPKCFTKFQQSLHVNNHCYYFWPWEQPFPYVIFLVFAFFVILDSIMLFFCRLVSRKNSCPYSVSFMSLSEPIILYCNYCLLVSFPLD